MTLFAYNPRTATAPVAAYVLGRFDLEIAAAHQAVMVDNAFSNSVLDVLSLTHPELVQDLQLLAASGASRGYDGGREEFLKSVREQFRAALPAALHTQFPPPPVQ